MRTSTLLSVLFAFLAVSPAAFSQGDLAPPGGPAPTMKTLDQIDAAVSDAKAKLDAANAKVDQVDAKTEKRIPIPALPFTIDTPGSYYLAKNLDGTAGQNGITVSASNVTIDLNGFRLAGPGERGIDFVFGTSSCTIRNGTIQGWAKDGIFAANATSLLVEDLVVAGNALAGIRVGQNSIVQSCTVRNNGSAANGFGISAGSGSMISKCTVAGTTGAGSIPLRGDSTMLVVDCVLRSNSGTGSNVMDIGSNGTVIRCLVTNNAEVTAGIATGVNAKVIECTASANTGAGSDGIVVGAGSEVRNCTASSNFAVGIIASSECVLVGNHCVSNTAAGMEVTGSGNRIEGNHLKTVSGIALIAAPGTGNLIIKNSASGQPANSGEYAIGSNNAVGPIVSRNNVAANTNPHANYDLDTP